MTVRKITLKMRKLGLTANPLPWDGVLLYVAGIIALRAGVSPSNSLAIAASVHWISHVIIVDSVKLG